MAQSNTFFYTFLAYLWLMTIIIQLPIRAAIRLVKWTHDDIIIGYGWRNTFIDWRTHRISIAIGFKSPECRRVRIMQFEHGWRGQKKHMKTSKQSWWNKRNGTSNSFGLANKEEFYLFEELVGYRWVVARFCVLPVCSRTNGREGDFGTHNIIHTHAWSCPAPTSGYANLALRMNTK